MQAAVPAVRQLRPCEEAQAGAQAGRARLDPGACLGHDRQRLCDGRHVLC